MKDTTRLLGVGAAALFATTCAWAETGSQQKMASVE